MGGGVVLLRLSEGQGGGVEGCACDAGGVAHCGDGVVE